MNFRRSGQGPTIVLIHGFCEDLDVWKNIESGLTRYFDVILIDLPGFGNSDITDYNFTIDSLAAQLDAFISELGVSGRYAVIGHSLGGYVALSMAKQFPDKIYKIALAHSTALADSSEKKLNRNRVIEFIETHGVHHFLGQFVPSLFSPQNVDSHKEAIESVVEMGKGLTSEIIIAYTKAMRDRLDNMQVLADKNVDTLFIYGSEDGIFSDEDINKHVEVLDRNHSIKLEKCGHMGMYESPTELLKALIQFIN